MHTYITQIDFEKAFDSIEWPFLLKTLKDFNFGDKFIKWIQILYTDIQSCVGNNGYYSAYFKLSRSIKQGCPISALLFLLVAEIIAIDIRSDNQIKGIELNDCMFKISLMADDTTLIITDLRSLELAIKKLKKFEQFSGLKLNMSKTELILIGLCKGKELELTEALSQISVNHGPFKALGVWYSTDTKISTELNILDRLNSMETLLNIWRSKKPFSVRKNNYIKMKTLILPQIQFLFSMIYIPEEILDKIDKLLFDYLWDNKRSKIKRTTMIAKIEDGGLGMIDVHEVHNAAKCTWIKRLNDETNSKWKISTLHMIGVPLNALNKNLDEKKQRIM